MATFKETSLTTDDHNARFEEHVVSINIGELSLHEFRNVGLGYYCCVFGPDTRGQAEEYTLRNRLCDVDKP